MAKCRLLPAIALVLIAVCYTNGQSNRPSLDIIKAGQDLALHPLKALEAKTRPQAPRDDTAMRRLRVKALALVDKIWENLNNPQRFAIIQDKGVEKEILKMFRLIQSDIFAMDGYIRQVPMKADHVFDKYLSVV